VLDKLVEMGCTNWDTADVYVSTIASAIRMLNPTDMSHSQGDSEDLIGKWFKRTGKRDQVRSCRTIMLNHHLIPRKYK
jgi:aryl-alcohol dehydrogenase-like predicted oxidoreductase